MDLTTKRFLAYIEIAKEFSVDHQYLDTAVFTLFENIEDGTAAKKKNIYKLKRLFFFIYVFYKYYPLKDIFNKGIIPTYKGTKILVIIHGSGPQHYGEMIRLVENLVDKGRRILIVYGTISAEQLEYLKSLNNIFLLRQDDAVYKIGIGEFITNISKTGNNLKDLFNAVTGNAELTELFKENKGFLLDQFFNCLCHYNYSRKIMEKNSFKAVFSTNDGNYLARSYFIHANRYDIENMITQHGFSTFLGTKAIANKVIIWSWLDMKYYIENNFPKERILPLGLPRFDTIKEENVIKENNFEKLNNIKNEEKKICFAFPLHAFNYNTHYYRTYIEEINNISSFLLQKGVAIFIRTHPNDNVKEYQKYFSEELLSEIIIPPPTFPLIQFIKQMDIYIADFSTSIIESMICGVPTIMVNFDNYWNKDTTLEINIEALGGCHITTSRKDLLPTIEGILNDTKFRADLMTRQNKFVEENIFNLGCATKSITDYILNQCR